MDKCTDLYDPRLILRELYTVPSGPALKRQMTELEVVTAVPVFVATMQYWNNNP